MGVMIPGNINNTVIKLVEMTNIASPDKCYDNVQKEMLYRATAVSCAVYIAS